MFCLTVPVSGHLSVSPLVPPVHECGPGGDFRETRLVDARWNVFTQPWECLCHGLDSRHFNIQINLIRPTCANKSPREGDETQLC
jgi:hypothetical protein